MLIFITLHITVAGGQIHKNKAQLCQARLGKAQLEFVWQSWAQARLKLSFASSARPKLGLSGACEFGPQAANVSKQAVCLSNVQQNLRYNKVTNVWYRSLTAFNII